MASCVSYGISKMLILKYQLVSTVRYYKVLKISRRSPGIDGTRTEMLQHGVEVVVSTVFYFCVLYIQWLSYELAGLLTL